MKSIRDRSGNVNANKLESFVYILLRDHIVPGELERIVQELDNVDIDTHKLSNGWLGEYAKDIIKRLTK